MRKRTLYLMCAILGAMLLLAVAEAEWLFAAIMGAALGIGVALVAHSYPHDIAPPADRRHEATRRRKAASKA